MKNQPADLANRMRQGYGGCEETNRHRTRREVLFRDMPTAVAAAASMMAGGRAFGRERINPPENLRSHALLLPQAGALLGTYRRRCEKEGTDVGNYMYESMQGLLQIISRLSLENVKVYEAASGAKFPYTSVSLAEVVDEIFEECEEKLTLEKKDPAIREQGLMGAAKQMRAEPGLRHKREFILPPIPWRTGQGAWFEYAEFPIRNILRMVPEALNDRKAGKPMFDYCIYTLGYPTHELGFVTDRYRHELETEGFRGLSRPLFALVSEIVAKMPEGNACVALTGVSLGAGVASEIGGILRSEAAVRMLEKPKRKPQGLLPEAAAIVSEQQKRRTPLMTIAMYLPAVLNEGEQSVTWRKIRLSFGLGIEAMCRWLTNPTFREFFRRRPEFEHATRTLLQDRSIEVNMDARQEKEKTACLNIFRDFSVEGMQVPKDVNTGEEIPTTQIVGTCDPLMSTDADSEQLAKANRRKILIRRPEEDGMDVLVSRNRTIAENWIPGTRRALINMGHLVPFSRGSTMATFDDAVDAVEALKAGTRIFRQRRRNKRATMPTDAVDAPAKP